jgi:hypothetical protein
MYSTIYLNLPRFFTLAHHRPIQQRPEIYRNYFETINNRSFWQRYQRTKLLIPISIEVLG